MQATNIQTRFYGDPRFDGILGMAFSGPAEYGDVPPVQNAVYQSLFLSSSFSGLLEKPIFTVYLTPSSGLFTYGAVGLQPEDTFRKMQRIVGQ